MTTQTNEAAGNLNPAKVQPIEIINGAVDAFLKNNADIKNKRDALDKITKNQLDVLALALKGLTEPVTEEMWDSQYAANASQRLHASGRYSSKGSRDVWVNVLKRATMGLSLLIVTKDGQYAPSTKARTNIRKYADEMRDILQKDIDPTTDKPRLKTIANEAAKAPKPKKLAEGSYYWLIGCADAAKGLAGGNSVIAGSLDLDFLKSEARRLKGKFATFLYVPAPQPEPLPMEEPKAAVQPVMVNSVVYADTFPPEGV